MSGGGRIINKEINMNIVFGMFSIAIGIYSLPLMINVLKNKVDESQSKVMYYFVSFLFITFPLINFINFLDLIFFQTYMVSYICGAYGFLFILFSFFAPKEEVLKN